MVWITTGWQHQRDVQEKVFVAVITMSKDLTSLRRYTRCFRRWFPYAIIQEWRSRARGGIMLPSGSLEEAKRFMDLEMMISFWVVTFKKATDVQEAAATGLPLGKILVETDASLPGKYQFPNVVGKIKQPTLVMW